MGSSTAEVANFIITGGASALSDKFQIFDESGKKKRAGVKDIGQNDKRKVTKGDVKKKNARTALIVGNNPQGVLNQSATTGRGTLLGN